MTWDFDTSVIKLIDKTNSTPTGITDGLTDGNLLDPEYFARLTQKKGDGLVPSAILDLYIPADGQFVRTDPILIDKDAPDKYLIEIMMTQDGRTPELQRYRLSTPTFTDDPDLGEILQIPLESIAYNSLKESRVSQNDELITPKNRVINLLAALNAQGGDQNVLLAFDEDDINIPDNDSLKFDYKPTSPKSLAKLLDDVIERIEQAGPLGGVFKNFYYDTFANPNSTNVINIFFEEFGNQNSGVIISPDNDQEASPNDKILITSNKKRKKVTITKFGNTSGSLRMEHARFASGFIHASNRPEWEAGDFEEGDTVKWTDTSVTPNVLRFFSANSDFTSSTNPNIDNTNWFEDFTIIPPWNEDAFYEGGTKGEVVTLETGGAINFFKANTDNGPSTTTPNLSGDWDAIMLARPASTYEGFTTYTPFTNDLPNSIVDLAGESFLPSGYIGFAVDWNYERILNDITDYTNRFKIVTGKSVRRIESNSSNVTTREKYDGFRVLIGNSPSNEFVGHAQQIAEFSEDVFQGISGHFEFSDDPVEGDTIPLNFQNAEMMEYDGGNWVVVWTAVTNNIKPSAMHAVKSAKLVKGSSGIPGQATEYTFEWKDSLVVGGDDINRTSRGAWYAKFYPTPIRDSSSNNLGNIYGGDGVNGPPNPRINHTNLNQTRTGLLGWNRGIESEDMGRLTSHVFKPKLGIWRSEDESEKSKGKANIPMVYWRKDNNSRFFFKEFSILENNEYITIKIALPPFGPTNLYFNRLDELANVLGYTIPFDLFIQEKEFAGVKYEFRKNDSWGIFMKDSYNNTGMYITNYQSALDNLAEQGSQLIPDTLEFINDVATGQSLDEFNVSSALVDHTTLAVDEEYYEKEGYAIFPLESVEEPRTDYIQMQQETDYLTARAKSESQTIKNDFYPNERHVACGGDIDIKYGQIVTEEGDRVPGGSLESVVATIESVFDNKGFNNRLFLTRKFVIT